MCAGEPYLAAFNAIFAVLSGPQGKAASGSDPLGNLAALEADTFGSLLAQVLLLSMVSVCQQQRSSWASRDPHPSCSLAWQTQPSLSQVQTGCPGG